MQGKEYSDILNNLIDWIITDCQLFKIVDGTSFKKLITSFNSGFQVSSRQTIQKKIDNKYE